MAFIAEQSDENDQRIRRVHLTEKGLEVYRHLLFYYVDLYKDLQNEIGQDTVGATIDQSKKIFGRMASMNMDRPEAK